MIATLKNRLANRTLELDANVGIGVWKRAILAILFEVQLLLDLVAFLRDLENGAAPRALKPSRHSIGGGP